MRCDKCQHSIPSVNSCVQDGCIYLPTYITKKHKCEGCPWGTWTGLSYKCALPRCIPNLGNFNGVDKNGQTKKNS